MSTELRPEHYAKAALYVLLILAALGFVQYALVNWNTEQSWYPFVAGPLMGISFSLVLAVIAFGGDYQLGMVLTSFFILLTMLAYGLTFDHSTIIDYEYMIALFAIILLLFVYLEYIEGSVDLKPIHLLMIDAVAYIPYLLYVILAFKLGSYYPYLSLVFALILALSNFLLFVPVFTESLIQAVIMTIIVLAVFMIYVLSTGLIGPDVTEWIVRATLLSSYLALLWTAVRSGWE